MAKKTLLNRLVSLGSVATVGLSLFLPISTQEQVSEEGKASVTLAWDANIEPDLAGYKMHHGLESRKYTTRIDVGNVTTSVVNKLEEGVTYYFAVTAYNTSGLESDYSNEVSYTTPFEGIRSPRATRVIVK